MPTVTDTQHQQNHIHNVQEHLSTTCSSITNTWLYQACTKVTNISPQDMCLYRTMYQTCTMDRPCTITCINKASTCTKTYTITSASTMHQNLYRKHKPSISTPYHVAIMYQPNLCYTMCQHYTMHQQCISTIYHITHDMSQSCHTPCII
jgi:hypothetical protein